MTVDIGRATLDEAQRVIDRRAAARERQRRCRARMDEQTAEQKRAADRDRKREARGRACITPRPQLTDQERAARARERQRARAKIATASFIAWDGEGASDPDAIARHDEWMRRWAANDAELVATGGRGRRARELREEREYLAQAQVEFTEFGQHAGAREGLEQEIHQLRVELGGVDDALAFTRARVAEGGQTAFDQHGADSELGVDELLAERATLLQQRRALRSTATRAETELAALPVATIDQRYVLLANSEGDRLVRPDGVSTGEALGFLCDAGARHPDAIHVGFGFSYDANQILRDLSLEQKVRLYGIRRLVNPVVVEEVEQDSAFWMFVQYECLDRPEEKYTVRLPRGEVPPEHIVKERPQEVDFVSEDGRRFHIIYRPRKSLSVKEWGDPPYTLQSKRRKVPRSRRKSGQPVTEVREGYDENWKASIVLWDVWGFFQSSFLVAIEKWLGTDHPTYQQIVKGKGARSDFTVDHLAQMVPYTHAECETLVEIMDRLRAAMLALDLRVKRWDGAGAVAAAILGKHDVKRHLPARPSTYNGELQPQFRNAYYGGRIEAMRYGTVPVESGQVVHHFDVCSAYPSVLATLPSLASGHWTVNGPGRDGRASFSISHVRWVCENGDAPFYPFPWRSHLGDVRFPPSGEGWYWRPEVDAALAALDAGAGDLGAVEILETYNWNPYHPGARPFGFVEDYYRQRAELKRFDEKNPARAPEKVIKLGLNSLYGKTAQSTGWSPDEDRLPPFHCIEWAGYVTSAVRAQLYSAGMQRPEAIVMFCTDGIYSTEPLDLPISSRLGEWEYSMHDGLVVVQSGVYWAHNPECRACAEEGLTDCAWHEYRRGFDAGSISRELVAASWAAPGKDGLYLIGRSRRFITFGSALSSSRVRHCTWRTISKRLSLRLENTKRLDPFTDREFRGSRPNRELIGTTARPVNPLVPWDVFPSSSYSLPWAEGADFHSMEDGVPGWALEHDVEIDDD